MKIKVLNSSGWYKKNVGEEFEVTYDINNCHSNTQFRCIKDKKLFFNIEDIVITELPTLFCVENYRDINQEKWLKYIWWLNKTYNANSDGSLWSYYGINNENKAVILSNPIGIEMHIDDIIKYIDYMESQQHIKGGKQLPTLLFYKEPQLTDKMENQKLSRKGLKEIHSVACTRWKEALEHYGTRNPLEDYIELSEQEVETMFKECTKEQLPIVSKYLKQDDGSIYLTNIKNDRSGFILNEKYIIRQDDIEHDKKSFWLNNDFKWEIKNVDDLPRLYPTKKK